MGGGGRAEPPSQSASGSCRELGPEDPWRNTHLLASLLVLENTRDSHAGQTAGLHFSLVSLLLPHRSFRRHFQALSSVPAFCQSSLLPSDLPSSLTSFLPGFLPSRFSVSSALQPQKLDREAVGQDSPPEGWGIWTPGSVLARSENLAQSVEGLLSTPNPLGSIPGIV